MMATEAVMIMTTVKDRGDATAMATHLIEGRLAACVQELAINSHFNWEGKINNEPEVLLLVKTAADRAEAAVKAIREKHSYDIPEVLVSPIIGGLGAYLQWVKDETREQGE
jgi:periplasmic divalent cation tolerance protein